MTLSINSCALLVLPRQRQQRGRRLRHILLVRHIYGEQQQHFWSAARDPSSNGEVHRESTIRSQSLRNDSCSKIASRTDRSEAEEEKNQPFALQRLPVLMAVKHVHTTNKKKPVVSVQRRGCAIWILLLLLLPPFPSLPRNQLFNTVASTLSAPSPPNPPAPKLLRKKKSFSIRDFCWPRSGHTTTTDSRTLTQPPGADSAVLVAATLATKIGPRNEE